MPPTIRTGGKRARTANPIQSAGTGSFPLSASANGRYLVTPQGTPFFAHGEAAWSAIANLSDSNQAVYLANCVTHNINALIVNLFEHEFSANAPNDILGNAPFTGTAFQSGLGSAYMTRAVAFVQACAASGICCFINPAYAGFGGGTEGWDSEINAASQAQRQAAGAAIGNYLKSEPNVVWMKFGDYNPPSHSPYNDIFTGISSSGDTHSLIGNHYGPNVSSHDDAESYTWDFVYRTGGVVSSDIDTGYAVTPAKPVLLGEAWYELENGATSLDIRRQAWGAFMAGGCGHFPSHRDIWGFGNGLFQVGTWQDAINNVGGVAPAREQMQYLRSFVAGLNGWQTGAPDRADTFVTAGRGTVGSAGYVTARYCTVWGAAYLPTGSTGGAITIDRTEFSSSFSWAWFNPRTGATGTVTSGVSNTGTQNFTASDGNDWVWFGWVP